MFADVTYKDAAPTALSGRRKETRFSLSAMFALCLSSFALLNIV